jgi:hypothetical protein
MTTKELMARCQDYYGLQYSTGMGAVVIQYLEMVCDDYKGHMFAETVKAHSVSFKSLPDVSTFEGVYDRAKADFGASRPQKTLLAIAPPSDLATKEDIEDFERWLKSQTWKKKDFTKVKDWKKGERL